VNKIHCEDIFTGDEVLQLNSNKLDDLYFAFICVDEFVAHGPSRDIWDILIYIIESWPLCIISQLL